MTPPPVFIIEMVVTGPPIRCEGKSDNFSKRKGKKSTDEKKREKVQQKKGKNVQLTVQKKWKKRPLFLKKRKSDRKCVIFPPIFLNRSLFENRKTISSLLFWV